MIKAIKNLHLISLPQGRSNIIEQQLSAKGGSSKQLVYYFFLNYTNKK
jgi:hypothetical protein